MPNNRRIASSLTLCLMFFTTAGGTADTPQVLAHLSAADTVVAKGNTPPAPRTHESLLTQLAEVDQTISAAEYRIAELQTDVDSQFDHLETLHADIEQGRNLSAAEQDRMLAQIRATWRLYTLQQRRAQQYRQPPSQWRRTERYLAAVASHLEKQRGVARIALVDVMSKAHEAEAVKRSFTENKASLRIERNNLKHLLASREPVLIQLEAATEQNGGSLITLYAETDDVRSALAKADSALADNGLPWPTVGPVKTAFGARVPNSDHRSQGIQIDVRSGETVHSVADGVVVFAGWLRGQGLLAVVDHGNGMMAVYGNNRRLLVEVGDRVTAGDPIASVGAYGDTVQAQLYFELRLEGQAVDPLSWLTTTPG